VAEEEGDHSPPPNATPPYVFMAWCLAQGQLYLTFTVSVITAVIPVGL